MRNRSLIWFSLFVIFGLMIAGCSNNETPIPTMEETQEPAPGFTPSQVCEVPDVVGLDQAAAEGMLAGVGLQPVKSTTYDPTVAERAVISQDPPAGTRMEPCEGDVTLAISLGPAPEPTEAPTATYTPVPLTPTPTATLAPPTPTSTPDIVRTLDIEAPVHKIDDDSPTFLTSFWLDTPPLTGSLLELNTRDVDGADSVWINGKIVGVTPQGTSSSVSLFVPASLLKAGKNDLRIEAHYWGSNADDFHVDKITLLLNQASVASEDKASEIAVETPTHHLGDTNVKEWSVPEPENTSYITFFELQQRPTKGAVLVLSTFHIGCLNPVRVNDNLIGHLPGYGQEMWVNDVQMYIPPNSLIGGANSLRIDTAKCEGLDDFMIKDMRLRIEE